MSAISTGKTDGQKKETFDTPEQAVQAARMRREAPPELIPDSDDWHTIITGGRIGGYRIDVGFYNGKFWTLGSTRPEQPVKIYAWDQAVRIRSSRGKPIDPDGALRLAEEIIRRIRKDTSYEIPEQTGRKDL